MMQNNSCLLLPKWCNSPWIGIVNVSSAFCKHGSLTLHVLASSAAFDLVNAFFIFN